MTTLINTYHVEINARPEVVFAYVADLTRHPEWSGGRLRIEAVSSGPVGVGSQYRSYGEVAVQKNRPNTVRVTEYKPPSRFAFVANDPDFGDVPHEFTFTPQAGGTLVERRAAITLPPIKALLFKTFVYPFLGNPAMEKSMQALKAKLEEKHA